MDIQERPSDVDAVELAKAYTLAEAQPKLANFRVDRYFGSGSTGYSANLELEASATFNELSRLAAVLADNAVIKQANVLAAKFEINTENNHPPLAEISLFDQIAKKYSVIGGKLSPGALEVRLATSVDRQTAISFASKLPQYKEIDQVYLENNPIIERHKIAQGSAASLESLIDLIRDQPQLKKIEAGGAALNITVPNTALLKKVDDTLSAHPAYHQVLISYTLGRSKVSKPAHLSVPLGVFIKLLEDEDLDSVNMGVSEQDGLNVSVYATQNISAYEMGKLLAVSGLGDPAAQVRVQVSSKTPPEKWSLKFSTADPGHIPDGKKVDANRVKELASGWQAGKDSLGK
ncbi:hypothetical protein UM93_02615 [Psychromicrobium lacuslunae]|uniref:Uncharacterized protein n=2 Tax=Psychromicrobium lacuslunae TaxID=1618207 RepID=A0A0D4BX40_9MICC|nr:hypothetical protein UM93_02615 [Psychromicrobium lacuslunae]